MTPPTSERELGALTEAINGIRREMERDHRQRDDEHSENSDKLDQLLGLKPMVESHDAWIKGPGSELGRLLAEAKGAGKLAKVLYVLGGGALGAGAYKVALAVAAALAR